ncbi:hypothetical protein K438DRAFT_2028237 [Mycena galopus ATCC 62051]|nr:hypothetical protein K438DRAFT_2028237 [Mycena galopus ATCC 62051]
MAPRTNGAVPPPPPPNLRKKRAAHPGKIAANRPKRSTEEVQQEKDDKAAKKKDHEDKRAAAIKKAAGIELDKEVKDLASDLTANHPPPSNKKKTLRPRPEKAVAREDDSAVAKGDAVDLVSDGDGGGDKYQLAHDQENEEDEVLDPSDNDTGAAPAKAAPKKDKKGRARLEVQISVEAQRALLASSGAAGKRKQAPDSEQKSKSQAQALGGLRDEFKRGRSPNVSKASNRSKSAGSAMSVDRYDTQYTDGDEDVVMPPQSDYNDSSEGIGGFDSEVDDGDEAEWAKSKGSEKAERRLGLENLESLAGIIDTTAPGLVPLKAKSGIKKKEISLDDLPPDIRSQFNSHFKPQFLRSLEPVAPWTGIESWMDIAPTWDAVFPKYRLHKNQVLQAVVVKLTEGKLGRWRHDFASTCTDSLGQLLTSWGQETPEDRAAAVESLLEKHVGYGSIFYYRQFYDEPTEENPAADGERDEPPLVINPKGLFGGHLIIAALASHYKAAYPRGVTPQQIFKTGWVPPEGPLVYSVLAAQRALTYYKSGKLDVPKNRVGEFSRMNWGDRTVARNGELVTINTTSNIVRQVRKLKDKQWRKIVEAAIAAAQPSHKGSAPPPDPADIVELEPEDGILGDNDSD